jgi:hypothetical protein
MVMTRYKAPPSRFIIRFEDRPGLEVVMRKLSVGELLDMAGLADAFTGGKATGEQAAVMFGLFASRLVEWNIDGDDDEPVPATVDGARSLDPELFADILNGWMSGMMQAPKASPSPSEPGLIPEEAESLPMAPLSVVRVS